ncbi:MAG: energy-coupling factor transporter ATPase [Clostridia bacterium]
MIELVDVVHSFESSSNGLVEALSHINLKINDGEFLVVLGHNGSGKSTLARHLNGLLQPQHGFIVVDGLEIHDEEQLWEIRKKVGMVFQNPDNQLVATTVEEDVAFGLENLGVPPEEIRKRVDEALERVGMAGFAKREPHHLSGGQKQRVAIAGVIAMKPDYLVLDEPTAMLDPKGRKEVLDTVHSLNKEEGLTVIHITHFMEEAVDADRVLVMENGKIMLAGTPMQVFKQVEELHKLRMDVPLIVELAEQLRQELPLGQDILCLEDMVEELCKLQ